MKLCQDFGQKSEKSARVLVKKSVADRARVCFSIGRILFYYTSPSEKIIRENPRNVDVYILELDFVITLNFCKSQVFVLTVPRL